MVFYGQKNIRPNLSPPQLGLQLGVQDIII